MLNAIHFKSPRIWRVTLRNGEIFYLKSETREAALESIRCNYPGESPDMFGATCAKMDRDGRQIRKHRTRIAG